MLIFMLCAMTSIGYAIASKEKNPINLSHFEWTRGQPTDIISIIPLEIAPCEISETRNYRDVDVRSGETIIIASEASLMSGIRKCRDVDLRDSKINYNIICKIAVSKDTILSRGNLGNWQGSKI